MIAMYQYRHLIICLVAAALKVAAFIPPNKQYQYQVDDTSCAQKPSVLLQSNSGDYLDRLSDDSFSRSSSSNGNSDDIIEYDDFGDFDFTPTNSISEQTPEYNSDTLIDSNYSTDNSDDNNSADSFFESLYKRQEQIAQSSRDLLEQWTSGMAKTTGAFTINEEFFAKPGEYVHGIILFGEYVYYDLLCLWDLLYLFVGSKLRCNIAVSFESFVHMIYSQLFISFSTNTHSFSILTRIIQSRIRRH